MCILSNMIIVIYFCIRLHTYLYGWSWVKSMYLCIEWYAYNIKIVEMECYRWLSTNYPSVVCENVCMCFCVFVCARGFDVLKHTQAPELC